MSRNPSVSLTEHQQIFVSDLVESGRYRGVSEVLRDGLRLLEQQEAERAALIRRLESAVDEGIASGPAEEMEPIADIVAEATRG